jgi:redox-sensitive bicupin YhaK (pirin superfamily)
MMTVRKGTERGVTDFGWLDSRHSFSFGDYYDPKHHNFHALRVINDDKVAPASGFPSHPHRDMEILTYVLDGELEHKDSMGTGAVVKSGEWQRMTAGTGIVHSEFNPSKTNPVHLLQIWIMPDKKGYTPEYDQKAMAPGNGDWRTVASPDGRDGSLKIHQDAVLATAKLDAGKSLEYRPANGRNIWLHVVSGDVTVNGKDLVEGDAVALEANEKGEPRLTVTGRKGGEVLLFDLA